MPDGDCRLDKTGPPSTGLRMRKKAISRPTRITANDVRYIRLGTKGGAWEQLSLDRGELHFGYGGISHEMALEGDIDMIARQSMARGRDPKTAAQDARQVLDFYQLGADCLWVTFARDHLWWAFAEPKVTWLGSDGQNHGERVRKTIGGWRNTDTRGVPLKIDTLSTRLTQVGSYRRTICGVGARDYLLRRINGGVEPLVQKGRSARRAMLGVMTEAIEALHWEDFETLVDVIFARSGWHRASALGGKQAVVDLVLEQPTTGEKAAVQVKSRADQGRLDMFIERADAVGTYDRLFFACHSPTGKLAAPDERDDIHVWSGERLAETAWRTGLADWVMEKIG
jgi:hypothetical protein